MPMNEHDQIRVLLVDDHAIVRTGISGMLSGVPRIAIVGEAADGREALAAVHELTPEVVLMDLRMPVMDGPEAIRTMRSRGLRIGILVLTTYDSDADILRAVEAGANGYLLKDTTLEELVQAIEATARGSSWLAPGAAAAVMRQMQNPAADRLSERELDVLRHVARGKSNKEIASEMHISQATVKTHLIHIYRKLDVGDRTSAVTAALERGLIAI